MLQYHCIALRSDDSPTCSLGKAETVTMTTAAKVAVGAVVMTVVDIVVMVVEEVVAVAVAVEVEVVAVGVVLEVWVGVSTVAVTRLSPTRIATSRWQCSR
jgi:hypothetical protein